MTQQQQPNQNPKTQGAEKNFDHDLGSNNPVKREGIEKRDNRENFDKANQNLGSERYRDSNVNRGQNDSSAR